MQTVRMNGYPFIHLPTHPPTHPTSLPKQDLVVPAFKRSGHFARSPYLGAEQPPRDVFAFFRGDLRIAPGQDPDCKYSRWGRVWWWWGVGV